MTDDKKENKKKWLLLLLLLLITIAAVGLSVWAIWFRDGDAIQTDINVKPGEMIDGIHKLMSDGFKLCHPVTVSDIDD